MLTSDLSLRVIDFGLAHQYQPLGERANSTAAAYKVEMLYHCCGSRSYCAPEVLSQAGYAFGADVWSCGVALFAMLLGFFPLEEASHADWRYDKLKRAQQDGKCAASPCPGHVHDMSATRAVGRQVHRLDGAAVVRQAAPPDGRGAQPPRRHARHRPG
mmetsp:Transcript_32967/g.97591  ORF Transcript_32967/g.97591 Transcript_32967/m.97591 type:complete len:158 (+) Transcript_32967:1026-1499(+)